MTRKVVRRKAITGAVLDVSTASLVYGLSEKSIRRMVERQLMPSRKLQSRVVFLRSELDQFFETLPGVTLKDARANAAMRRKQ